MALREAPPEPLDFEALAAIFDDDGDHDYQDSEEPAAPPIATPSRSATPTGSVQLYDVAQAESLADSCDCADTEVRRRLTKLGEEMIGRGGFRKFCPVPTDVSGLAADLKARFPNFDQVIDWVENHLLLSTLNGRVYFPPLLLVGPPGVGKTLFASSLAGLIGTSYREVHFETAQSNSGLSGSAEYWYNSKPGEIFDVLVRGRYINPLVMVDEIDKTGGGGVYDPHGSLYQLLEQDCARRFRDLSVTKVTLDASKILWVLTANDETVLPEPLLSRMTAMRVESPEPAQAVAIARQIYSGILVSMNLKEEFESELADPVAEQLASRAPREMRNLLVTALARAVRAGRRTVEPEDIVPTSQPSQRRMGFVQ